MRARAREPPRWHSLAGAPAPPGALRRACAGACCEGRGPQAGVSRGELRGTGGRLRRLCCIAWREVLCHVVPCDDPWPADYPRE